MKTIINTLSALIAAAALILVMTTSAQASPIYDMRDEWNNRIVMGEGYISFQDAKTKGILRCEFTRSVSGIDDGGEAYVASFYDCPNKVWMMAKLSKDSSTLAVAIRQSGNNKNIYTYIFPESKWTTL